MNTRKKFRYDNIFTYSTLQFAGNVEKYLADNTRKLVVYVVLPRFDKRSNLLRVYKNSKLVIERKVLTSTNIFLYYLFWYVHYIYFIVKYFSYNETFFVFSSHPITFFGITLQRIFRKPIHIYWVCDYFPGNNPINYIYTLVSYFYHSKVPIRIYLSDRINKKMNGSIRSSVINRTVMWGIMPYSIKHTLEKKGPVILCFVGVFRESQGIELLIRSLKKTNNVYLKLLGPCPQELYERYTSLIRRYMINDRIFFPNRTFYGEELEGHLKESHIGVAFYKVNKQNATYYADPAKIKTYTQYGLPVIMTDIADVSKYIAKFQAGEVVDENVESVKKAIKIITKNYYKYIKGVKDFNNYFEYNLYYKKNFFFLENYESN